MNVELHVAQTAVEKTSYVFGIYDAFALVLFIAVSVLVVVDSIIPWIMEIHKKDFNWNKRPVQNAISIISKMVVSLTIISCIVYALIAADKSFPFIFSVIFLPVALALILFTILFLIYLFVYKFIYEPVKWLVNKLKK